MSDASTAKTQSIAYNDELAEEIWSTDTHFEVFTNNPLQKLGLMSEAKGDEDAFDRKPGSAIQVHSEYGKEPGQKITIAMIRKLKRGLRLDENGATTLTAYTRGTVYPVGYEELPRNMYANLWVSLIRHQVAQDMPATWERRTHLKMEPTTRRQLTDWLIDKDEEILIDGLLDGASYPAVQESLVSRADNQNTYYVTGAATDDTVDSTMKMSARELRRIMRMVIAKNLQPIKVEGEEAFAVLMSNALITDLLQDTEYQTVVAQAATRGASNPLISGSIGKFYNLYIIPYDRARCVTGKQVEQVMILGAGAILLGYGSDIKWAYRQESGYNSRWGMQIARIEGAGRGQFYDTTTNGGATYVNQTSGVWKVYKNVEPWDA